MANEDYANACAEVVRILDHIPYRDYKKIPKDVTLLLEKNASNNFDFQYDVKHTLDEQNVSKIAKRIIAILYRDYWATSEQKSKIIDYEKIRDENSKKEKFDLNNIFKDNIKNDIIENKDIIQEESLVDVHNIKWYEKIWKKITNLFKK